MFSFTSDISWLSLTHGCRSSQGNSRKSIRPPGFLAARKDNNNNLGSCGWIQTIEFILAYLTTETTSYLASEFMLEQPLITSMASPQVYLYSMISSQMTFEMNLASKYLLHLLAYWMGVRYFIIGCVWLMIFICFVQHLVDPTILENPGFAEIF